MRISLSLAAILVLGCGSDRIAVGRAGDLLVLDPLVMVTAAPDIASLYFTLQNEGADTDTLRGLSSSRGTATLHTVVTESGRTRMQPVSVLTIPAGGDVVLQPGSYHVMLTGLAEPALPGDTLAVRLTFAVNGQVEFRVPVVSFADGMERFER